MSPKEINPPVTVHLLLLRDLQRELAVAPYTTSNAKGFEDS